MRWLDAIRNDSTSPSTAAVMAPATGPNTRADAKMNVSAIEKLMGMPGTRSVAQLLATVSARKNHHFESMDAAGQRHDRTTPRPAPSRITPRT